MRFLYLLLIGSLFIPAATNAQKKIALIVAIGEYPKGSSWNEIASINDIRYIKAALKKNGFLTANIDTLKNSKATKVGILKSLDALATKAIKNDIVFIHFACHGQQVYDQLTLEEGKDEEDGYDEALAPYDSKGKCDPGQYIGENHIRDDELSKKFTAIREKIGSRGSLLILIDACHSGTASRAGETLVSRGYPRPFMNCIVGEQKHQTDVPENQFIGRSSDSAANMVVISASGPHQVNKQMQLPNPAMQDGIEQVGSLSYAFYKAANELGPDCNYQLLFEKIKAVIQGAIPDQLPMIEGNTKQQVFSGAYTKEEPGYAAIASIIGDSGFSIDKGTINNVGAGISITIYKGNDKTPYSEGIIEKAGHFQSLGSSKKPLKKGVPYRVKLDALNFGAFSAAIVMRASGDDITKTNILQSQVMNYIKPYQYLSVKDKGDMMLEFAAAPNGKINLSLFERSDSARWSTTVNAGDSLSKDACDALLANIKKTIRVKYLRSLEDGGDLAKGMEVKIIPHQKKVNPSEIEMEPGEGFTLQLVNKGWHVLFYTIINITADNNVSLSVPAPGVSGANFFLARNTVKEFTRSKVDPKAASGKEMFKIIFTKQPLDLASIFERKKERSLTMSFQEMVDDLYKDEKTGQATRSDVSNVNLDEIGIITVGFTVKKP